MAVFALSAENLNDLKAKAIQFVFKVSQFSGADENLAHELHADLPRKSEKGHCRLAIYFSSKQDLLLELENFIQGQTSENLMLQENAPESPRIILLFTGQGSQYPDMGRGLFEGQKTFRESMIKCDQILKSHLGISLLDILYNDKSKAELVNQTRYTQPALFALEYSIAQMWKSFGVEFSAMIGHSVGEYAAHCLSGTFSLEDGLHLISERARLMQSLPPGGGMTATLADVDQINKILAGHHGQVSIAAVNGPKSTVISGPLKMLEPVHTQLQALNIRFVALNVSHAFHSLLVDPILNEFEAVANRIPMTAPRIPVLSNLTGGYPDPLEVVKGSYWKNHLRGAVRFNDNIQTSATQGPSVYLEVGPSAALCSMGRVSLPVNAGHYWHSTLLPGVGDMKQFEMALGFLFVRGCSIDWSALKEEGGEFIQLFDRINKMTDHEVRLRIARRA